MSVKMSAWAWDARGLAPVERLVLLALADWANDDGECWPGQTTIAEKIEASESTVRRVLKWLEACGVISSEERRRPDGYRTSNLYRLAYTSPVNLTGSPHRSNVRNLTGQIDTPHRSLLTGQEPSVEPPVETTSNNNSAAGRATEKQVEMIRDLVRASGRWTTEETDAEWRALSIAQADLYIRELKSERERHQA